MDKKLLDNGPFGHKTITVSGVKGLGLFKKLKTLFKLPISFLSSSWILFRFRPDVVVGVGGYASGPVVLAAWVFAKPVLLQEQNVLPGITNRLLYPLADRVCESFPGSFSEYLENKSRKVRRKKWLKMKNKLLHTGNPVRKSLFQGTDTGKKDKFTVLVLGGSQGAHAVNMSVKEALPLLKGCAVHIIQQTGDKDADEMRAAFRETGVDGIVEPFFFDMAALYACADLIISRAGATTTAELTALGKAVVFIPFPHAADDHQMLNARILEREGAAVVIPEAELTGDILSETIRRFMTDANALKTLCVKAKKFGKPEAASVIVDKCYEIMKKKYINT